MAKYRVTQVKSLNGALKNQKASMATLGIRKMHHTVEVEKTPSTEGLIRTVRHLVKVEEI